MENFYIAKLDTPKSFSPINLNDLLVDIRKVDCLGRGLKKIGIGSSLVNFYNNLKNVEYLFSKKKDIYC